MLTTRPRGTNDFLPGTIEKWQYIENTARDLCKRYLYQEIRTPIFEHTELFHRGVGETTDIVEKEMYSFEDRGNRNITLRPEGTASTVRAFLENKIYAQPQPTKLYYIGPMFRYDRPQAGRYRQFHQFGVEVFGSNHPSVDAEVIGIACNYLKELGLKGLKVHINTVGCPTCRPKHKEDLIKYYEDKKELLCKTCQGRLEKNPLRILDCKNSQCKEISKNAPTPLSSACEECRTHFENVQAYLTSIDIQYFLDQNLVRGLDYYTNTAFEILVEGIGAQNAICGGGRYNGLVEQCGGISSPGIGFALGLERLLLTLEEQGLFLSTETKPDIYVAPLGTEAQIKAFEITMSLREKKYSVEKDYLDKSLKAQMKTANKLGAKYAIIIGENEIKNNNVVVRDMLLGEQFEISFTELLNFLEGRLNNE